MRYPQMHEEIVRLIGKLSDPEYQQKVWVDRIYPTDKFFDNFEMTENRLEDMDLDNPHDKIGWYLRNQDEARAIKRVMQQLDIVMERHMTPTSSDADYLAAPEWPAVVDAARAALKVLKAPDLRIVPDTAGDP